MSRFGLLFDMDGVIVDNHVYHFQSWQKLCKKYGKPLTEQMYRDNMNGRTLTEVVKYIFGEGDDIERIRAIGQEKEEMYREIYQPHLSLTSGLGDFLEEAKKAGIPMVVGTSAPVENVEFTLDGLKIREYFAAVLDERAVTKGKPNPEIYMNCAAAIDLPNSKCVVVEDAISGIKAGVNAGSKVVGLATSHHRDELQADLILDDFRGFSLKQVEELISN